MEEIKTSIEKIFDQFAADTASYTQPKRLSYNYLLEPQASAAKKRKLSLESTPNTSVNNQSTVTIPDDSVDANITRDSTGLDASIDSQVSCSPWQVRRLRADAIECNATITRLTRDIDARAKAHKHMESSFKIQVSNLEKQLQGREAKVKDLEKHLRYIRGREASHNEELVKSKNSLAQQKCKYDDMLDAVERANRDLEDQLRQTRYDLSQKISSLQSQYNEIEQKYLFTQNEFEVLQKNSLKLQEKGNTYNVLDSQHQMLKHQHDIIQIRVKELENEVAAFGEWKELSKTFHNRITKMPDLEHEVERLKRDNKSLHETIGNKLLLEEEVFDLKSRLQMNERSHEDNVALMTKLKSTEEELREYKAIATDHCPASSAVSAAALRVRIETILQNDVYLASEKSAIKNEKESVSSQMQNLRKELEIYTKANGDLQTSLKYHKASLHRVQKKLQLVAKERDCYKQLIENYEKDLTINNAVSELNPDVQIRIKVEMLENTVAGYKEMCANMEKQLQAAKSLPDLSLDTVNSETYERFKKDMQQLRQENENLRRRKDELELIIEQSNLKDAFNIDKFKIVHMSMNPSAEAQENYKVEVEKLQAEIERLRRKNRKLEQDHEELTTRINDTVNITQDLKELSSLRDQLKSLENKNKQIKEIYKKTSQEFREVCYMLFGFRVDRVGGNNYRVSSMYAENEDEYLNFRLSEIGGLDMLETNYSASLADMIGVYLGEHNSLPAFMCTLTLDLFNRTTMA